MNKLVIITLFVVLSAAIVSAAAFNAKTEASKVFTECSKDCAHHKKQPYTLCKEAFKGDAAACKTAYTACREAVITEDRTEARREKRACSGAYTECRKQTNRDRVSCSRQSMVGYKGCRAECQVQKEYCLSLFAPVCGADGNTYRNTCLLGLAEVDKEHDGSCESKADPDAAGVKITCQDGQCFERQCRMDRHCEPYFSHCSCSWHCVREASDKDCARNCMIIPEKPSCGCDEGVCVTL